MIQLMSTLTKTRERTFKTAWFAKSAKKAQITDTELCNAVQEVLQGQADDLGGGVFKKRLHRNTHRSIVLAKGGQFWIYTYLFAKKDRDNINDEELLGFRQLAKYYAELTSAQVSQLVSTEQLKEICHDNTV